MACNYPLFVRRLGIIEQVAWNKSSLLLKIQMQNTQRLQLFTEMFKTDRIFKSN
jgi:hypothetical protein